eukprot:5895584-Prymnesium_polylepis.1
MRISLRINGTASGAAVRIGGCCVSVSARVAVWCRCVVCVRVCHVSVPALSPGSFAFGRSFD